MFDQDKINRDDFRERHLPRLKQAEQELESAVDTLGELQGLGRATDETTERLLMAETMALDQSDAWIRDLEADEPS